MSNYPNAESIADDALRALTHAVLCAVSEDVSKVELDGDVLTVFDSDEIDVRSGRVTERKVISKFRLTLTRLEG